MTDKKVRIGIICVILSAVLFGMMPLMARIAYAHGGNAYTVAFGRFFFGSLVLGLVVCFLPGCSLKITGKQLRELLKLSVPYAMVPVLLYISYNYIDSGMATTLHFTYPVTVMLILVVFCRERMDRKQVLCAVICLCGLGLLYTPDGQMSIQGILLAVGSGIVFAVYIVLLGKSKVKTLHPLVLAFWISLLTTIEIGLVAQLSGNFVLTMDAAGWAAEVGLALLATVFALVLFQEGVILCGEVKASLFSTFEPLTGIIIGVMVFQETLSGKEIAGIVGILLAAVLLVIPLGHKE